MIEVQVSYKKEEYSEIITEDECKTIFNKCILIKEVSLKSKDTFCVSVYLTDNEEMQQLNYKYRNIDSPTDVLTFAATEDETFTSDILGDIVISVPFLKSNAKALGVDEKEELTRLLIHGFLHALGFNHQTNNFIKEEMLILQERLMKLI